MRTQLQQGVVQAGQGPPGMKKREVGLLKEGDPVFDEYPRCQRDQQ